MKSNFIGHVWFLCYVPMKFLDIDSSTNVIDGKTQNAFLDFLLLTGDGF